MDPNLFHLDWERTFEVLATIVVLAFIVERALSVLFENRWWLKKLDAKVSKELIAFVVSAGACVYLRFDALSMVVLTPRTGTFGELLTGAVIAGGSKAPIKLFRDVLDFQSTASRERGIQLAASDRLAAIHAVAQSHGLAQAAVAQAVSQVQPESRP